MNSESSFQANTTAEVQSILNRLCDGDQSQVQVLLNATMHRLTLLARKVSGNIPGVKRFEQTDDVLQNSMIRLWRALDNHHPTTPLDYYRLASSIMRRELIDLSRHHFGALGMGANLARSADAKNQSELLSPIELARDETNEPSRLDQWTEFHKYVDSLADDEKALFDLMWYQGVNLDTAAELLGSSERTIRRRWKEARLKIQQALADCQ